MELLDATTQTLAWSVVFFFASAAASSAYLTVSEVFPLEMRALAISDFLRGRHRRRGFAAPALFGALIETRSRGSVFIGYAIGAALVLAAALIAWRWAVDAERKPPEQDRAPPWARPAKTVLASASRRAAGLHSQRIFLR